MSMAAMSDVVLTGIKPTGDPHLGNYAGAIRPAIRLSRGAERSFVLIADYHALTDTRSPAELDRSVRAIAAAWLASGLDPDRTVLYRQSDVPAILELAWILACLTPKGLMNRAHAYKAAVARNQASGVVDEDAGVSVGLFAYPVLMAADILLFGARVVPVGRDQIQHVEIARDLAQRFNATYGEELVLPEARAGDVEVLPGIDGRKMSKRHGNTIPLFAPPAEIRRLVARVVTDSSSPSDPKDPARSTLFRLYEAFAAEDEIEVMRRRFEQGIGWGEVKDAVAAAIDRALAGPRAAHDELIRDPARVGAALARGGERARAIAAPAIDRVRRAVLGRC